MKMHFLQQQKDYVTNYRNMFLIVGGSLSIIIALIGILNFFNAILTSIYSRRIEFAMLISYKNADQQTIVERLRMGN